MLLFSCCEENKQVWRGFCELFLNSFTTVSTSACFRSQYLSLRL